MITVLDYGINNIRSIEKALQFVGADVQVSKVIPSSGKLVIPGVGAFGAAMAHLAPLKADIKEFASQGHSVLGICLGMQLLFDRSEEFGDHEGLGLIPGRIRYLKPASGIKIPHMGWSTTKSAPGQLFAASPETQYYYVHSLIAECASAADVVGTAIHGEEFVAIVQRENVYGTQFHPEKSGRVGLELLRKFALC